MANAFSVTTTVAQGMLNGTGLSEALGASPKIRIYAGAVPADADATPSSPTLLAELTMAATPFSSFTVGSPNGGKAVFGSVTSDSSADNSGIPAYFRILDSAGTTTKCQGTAGASDCDLNLGVASIAAGAIVSISSGSITLPTS